VEITKKNQLSQSLFRCKTCGFELNADLNASRNLFAFGIAVRERASVNSPNVAISPPKLSIKLVDKPFPSVFGGTDQLQAPEFTVLRLHLLENVAIDPILAICQDDRINSQKSLAE
jgi:hypothetical protein